MSIYSFYGDNVFEKDPIKLEPTFDIINNKIKVTFPALSQTGLFTLFVKNISSLENSIITISAIDVNNVTTKIGIIPEYFKTFENCTFVHENMINRQLKTLVEKGSIIVVELDDTDRTYNEKDVEIWKYLNLNTDQEISLVDLVNGFVNYQIKKQDDILIGLDENGLKKYRRSVENIIPDTYNKEMIIGDLKNLNFATVELVVRSVDEDIEGHPDDILVYLNEDNDVILKVKQSDTSDVLLGKPVIVDIYYSLYSK